MTPELKSDIIAILASGVDLTLATLRADGWPQATTVSYASDGLSIFFGCGAASQKAANLARDPRVSLTVNLPYRDWAEIRGLSMSGRAKQLTDQREIEHAGLLFLQKFPEVAQYASAPPDEMLMFRIEPDYVSVLDYRKGFGHTELVRAEDLRAAA